MEEQIYNLLEKWLNERETLLKEIKKALKRCNEEVFQYLSAKYDMLENCYNELFSLVKTK